MAPVQSATAAPAAPTSKKRIGGFLFGFGALIVVAVAAFAVSNNHGVRAEDSNVASPSIPNPSTVASGSPVLKHFHSTLYSGVISVPARNVTWKCFSVAANQENPRMTGRYLAVGGSGNDIQFVVAPEDSFTAWRTTGTGHLLYDSGKMTTGGVEVPIPGEGRYCAGFSNRFSTFTSKSISADISLDFATWAY